MNYLIEKNSVKFYKNNNLAYMVKMGGFNSGVSVLSHELQDVKGDKFIFEIVSTEYGSFE